MFSKINESKHSAWICAMPPIGLLFAEDLVPLPARSCAFQVQLFDLV